MLVLRNFFILLIVTIFFHLLLCFPASLSFGYLLFGVAVCCASCCPCFARLSGR